MSEIPLILETVVLLPLFLGRCSQSSSLLLLNLLFSLLINHANNPFFSVSKGFHFYF